MPKAARAMGLTYEEMLLTVFESWLRTAISIPFSFRPRVLHIEMGHRIAVVYNEPKHILA